MQKNGELLDSPLLSEIDEVIKNLSQEKARGPERATGYISKTFDLVLSVNFLDELNHMRNSGGLIPASPDLQMILVTKRNKDIEIPHLGSHRRSKWIPTLGKDPDTSYYLKSRAQ